MATPGCPTQSAAATLESIPPESPITKPDEELDRSTSCKRAMMESGSRERVIRTQYLIEKGEKSDPDDITASGPVVPGHLTGLCT
jgi:hypothetical protein